MKTITLTFDLFLELFPEADLPLTFSTETHHQINAENNPMPVPFMEHFIAPLLDNPIDEFTEVTPCFRLKDTYDFHAFIFWVGDLLTKKFYLATFDKKGNLIDKTFLAGTISDKHLLTQVVATIEDDWLIYVAEGYSDLRDLSRFDASSNKIFNLELLGDGKIVKI